MAQNPNAPKNPMTRRPSSATATGTAAAPSTPAPGPSGTPFGRPGGDDDFVINLDGVDLSGGHIGPGDWTAYVSQIEKGQSKAGNPMITWTFTLYDGPYAGKSAKVYTALTPDAMWKFAEVCDAVAYPIPEDKQVRFGELKKHALRTLVVVTVVEGVYNGRPSNSIDTVYPTEEPGQKINSPGSPRV